MNIVILGKTSAEKLAKVIKNEFDYIDITTYPNRPKFFDALMTRNMDIDRLIILEDALESDLYDINTLQSFYDYINKYYPAMRVIFLMKSSEHLQSITEIFYSQFMVALQANTIKVSVLRDIAVKDIGELRKKYSSLLYVPDEEDRVLGGVFGGQSNEKTIAKERIVEKPVKKKKFLKLNFFKNKNKNTEEEKTINNTSKINVKSQKPSINNDLLEEDVDNEEDNLSEYEFKDIDEGELFEELPSFPFGGFDSPVEDSKKTNKEDYFEKDSYDEDNSPLNFDTEDNSDENFGFEIFDTDKGSNVGVPVDWGSVEQENNKSSVDDFDWSSLDTGNQFKEITNEENSIENNETHNNAFDIDEEYDEDDKEDLYDIPEVDEGIENDIEDKVDRLKQIGGTVFEKDIVKPSVQPKKTRVSNIGMDIQEAEGDIDQDILEGFDQLNEQYEKSTVKVVETVIEKVVNVGKQGRRYKNGVRVVIVTGDRKTGITKTSLNLAKQYAKQGKTLYVDLDIVRKGSLLYLGLNDIVDEEEHIQNGLYYYKTNNVLPNVVHTHRNGFDCLISTYGVEINKEHLENVQRNLSTQREYKSVIVDCPIEYLDNLKDLILYSEILVCVQSSLNCLINTIIELSTVTEDESLLTAIYNNLGYFLTSDDGRFTEYMQYIEEIFSLEDSDLNYSKVPVLGSVANFGYVIESL